MLIGVEGDSPLSLIGGGGSSSFLPFSFVVVTALLLLSSTFSLACTFGGGRFSLMILSHSLSCDGGGFAFPPLQNMREHHHKAVRREQNQYTKKLKKRATKKKGSLGFLVPASFIQKKDKEHNYKKTRGR